MTGSVILTCQIIRDELALELTSNVQEQTQKQGPLGWDLNPHHSNSSVDMPMSRLTPIGIIAMGQIQVNQALHHCKHHRSHLAEFAWGLPWYPSQPLKTSHYLFVMWMSPKCWFILRPECFLSLAQNFNWRFPCLIKTGSHVWLSVSGRKQ